MKVSVVTISFDQRDFLEEAIESVLRQREDGVDVEYIVVDPGSTDGSRELIKSYGRSIDHVIFEPDDGPADGLLKGFDRATGDVLCYLNSDDYFLPGAFRKVTQHFARWSPDVLLADGYRRVDPAGTTKPIVCTKFTARKALYGAAVFMQQGSFFTPAAYRAAGGFNRTNRTSWDAELLIRMKINGAKFRNLHEPVAVFRIHSSSISGSGRLEESWRADSDRLFREILRHSPRLVEALAWRWISRVERLPSHLFFAVK